MAEEQQDDLAKVQDFIRDEVRSYLDSNKPAPVEPQRQPVVVQDDVNKQAKEYVQSLVSDDIKGAHFSAEDAKDFASFYMNNPLASEYKDRVEKFFADTVKAGRPVARGDILKWIRGGEHDADPDGFNKKESERRKAQVERAESAADFGAGLLTKAQNDVTFANFDSLSVEEMEKALDGITF